MLKALILDLDHTWECSFNSKRDSFHESLSDFRNFYSKKALPALVADIFELCNQARIAGREIEIVTSWPDNSIRELISLERRGGDGIGVTFKNQDNAATAKQTYVELLNKLNIQPTEAGLIADRTNCLNAAESLNMLSFNIKWYGGRSENPLWLLIAMDFALTKGINQVKDTAEELYKMGLQYSKEECEESGRYAEEMAFFYAAALRGHADAQYRIGIYDLPAYETGRGSSRNKRKYHPIWEFSIEWLLRAACQKHVGAQYALGTLRENGYCVNKSIIKATRWYKKAATQGHVDAQYRLGRCYEEKLGERSHLKTAIRWHRMAAEQGHIKAHYRLGYCYERGQYKLYLESINEAYAWYRLSLERARANDTLQRMLRCWSKLSEPLPRTLKQLKSGWRTYEDTVFHGKESLRKYNADCIGTALHKSKLRREHLNLVEIGRQVEHDSRWLKLHEKERLTDYTGELHSDELLQVIERVVQYAQTGNAEAQYCVGYCCENGLGVNQNLMAAEEWYLKAATQDHAEAQYRLADCLQFGHFKRGEENIQEAYEWYHKAAEQGHAEAEQGQFGCARILKEMNSTGDSNVATNPMPRATSRGVQLWPPPPDDNDKRIAKLVDYISRFSHGFDLTRDEGSTSAHSIKQTPAIRKENVRRGGSKWTNSDRDLNPEYERAYEEELETQMTLASQHYTETKIMESLRDPIDQYDGGWDLQDSEDDDRLVEFMIDKRYENWYNRAIQGSAGDQYAVGLSYMDGENGAPSLDLRKATVWLRKAAVRGNANAQYAMGHLHEKGMTVDINVKKAVQWYGKAAEQDHTKAMYRLGYFYELGSTGIERSHHTAAMLYRRAAFNNHYSSQYRIGKCYEQGIGIEQDYKKAMKWYTYAASRVSAANFRISALYFRGLGVEQDQKQALHWAQIAASEAQWQLMQLSDQSWVEKEMRGKECLHQLAEEGNVNALFELGLLYKQENDPSSALKIFFDICKQAEGLTFFECCTDEIYRMF